MLAYQPRTVMLLCVVASLAACESKDTAHTPPASAPPQAAKSAAVGAQPASSAEPTRAAPIAQVPAGTLVAGSACGDHPRMPSEELPGTKIEMAAFDIDVFPYPNDPMQPPKTGVSRPEAQKLCEARGRRLCTELEWERACKGPNNTMYEYGKRFDAKRCPTGLGAVSPPASFATCKSDFGVAAMHGFVWEWTSSDWGRGGDEGVAQRGGFGGTPYANMRCASVRSAAPEATDGKTGFRCCGGPANTAVVSLPAPDAELAQVEVVDPVDDGLTSRFANALRNGGFQPEGGVTYSFGRAWRWRPVRNEELFVVEYKGTRSPTDSFVLPFVVQLCPSRALLRAGLRGPVDSVQAPEVDAGVLVLPVGADQQAGQVRYTYQYGQVNLSQPSWVQPSKPAASTAPPSSAGAVPTQQP